MALTSGFNHVATVTADLYRFTCTTIMSPRRPQTRR